MDITKLLERLQGVLENANEDELRKSFPSIAEALDIDTAELNEDNTDEMVRAIKTAVEAVEEDDAEAVVEEIEKFFVDEETDESESDELDEQDSEDDDEEDDDEDEKEEESYSKKKKKKNEDFYVSAEDLDVSEDVNAIFNGEELTEEFQEKAKTIFETAVVRKVNEKVEQIIEEFDDMLEEKTQELEESYAGKIDEYLNYVVNEWVEENRLAITKGIQSEMTESFIDSLKSVFEDHYIEVPEEKVDMVEELQNKVQELESGLNEALDQNAKLTQELRESSKEDAIEDTMEGLTDYQKEKLRSLLEGIEVEETDKDFSGFKKKATIVRENYFPSEETLNEETVDDEPADNSYSEDDLNEGVNKYAQALSRMTWRK